MEGQTERTRLMKLILLILVFHGIVLFVLAFPLRFIEDYYLAVQDIDFTPMGPSIFTLFAAFFFWFNPRKKTTKAWLILTIIYDALFAILVFIHEFSWVITEIRILFSIIYFLPVLPLLSYVFDTDFTEEDITEASYYVLINEEIMKHPTLELGLDYVLEYIADPQWKFEPGYKEAFLEFLSKRDDELGQLAHARLDLTE